MTNAELIRIARSVGIRLESYDLPVFKVMRAAYRLALVRAARYAELEAARRGRQLTGNPKFDKFVGGCRRGAQTVQKDIENYIKEIDAYSD